MSGALCVVGWDMARLGPRSLARGLQPDLPPKHAFGGEWKGEDGFSRQEMIWTQPLPMQLVSGVVGWDMARLGPRSLARGLQPGLLLKHAFGGEWKGEDGFSRQEMIWTQPLLMQLASGIVGWDMARLGPRSLAQGLQPDLPPKHPFCGEKEGGRPCPQAKR